VRRRPLILKVLRLCRALTSALKLQPYQGVRLESCLGALKGSSTKIGVSLPTGAGKTTIFVSLLEWLRVLSGNPRARNVTMIHLLCQQATIGITNALLFRSVQAGTRENLRVIDTQKRALATAHQSREGIGSCRYPYRTSPLILASCVLSPLAVTLGSCSHDDLLTTPDELRDVGISQTLVAAPRMERSDRLTEMGHQTPIEPHLEREVRWLSHEHSPYRQWEPAQPSLPDDKPSQSNRRFCIGTEANVMKVGILEPGVHILS